jgi:hypothetical protein
MSQTILDELIVALENQYGRARMSIRDYGFRSWLDILKQSREVMISLGEAANEHSREIIELRKENYLLRQKIKELENDNKQT